MYAHLEHAIRYILKPEKTAGGLYTGSLNCSCQTALTEMAETKRQYGKEPVPGSKSYETDRLAYHFVLSWSPREQVPPELALHITQQFCEEVLRDYEAVYSAHTDTAHMHTHIIFNSVNYKNGHKYRYRKRDWERMLQPLLDRLCKEYGLHTLEEDTGKSLMQNAAERRRQMVGKSTDGANKKSGENKEGYTLSDYIREDIDALIGESRSFDEFEEKLEESGYELKYGKSEKYGEYMAVKNAEMKNFRKTYILGADYTLDMIKRRIAAYHEPLPGYEEPGGENMFLISGRIYRCRIYYRTDNPFLRREYARLYRLGIVQTGMRRPSYQETRARIRELRRIEYQISMIAEQGYQSDKDLDEAISNQKQRVTDLKKELSELRREKRPFENMYAVCRRLEQLEGDYLLYQEGESAFREGAEEYVKLEKEAEKFGHTGQELEEYLEWNAFRVKQKKRMLGKEMEKLAALTQLKEEYSRVMEEFEPADEKMLEALERRGGEAEIEKTKEKRKER